MFIDRCPLNEQTQVLCRGQYLVEGWVWWGGVGAGAPLLKSFGTFEISEGQTKTEV